MRYLGKPREERDAWRVERGERALDFMENQLKNKNWFVGNELSIADIALLAYTRVADEGGFDMASRNNIANWIGRCEDRLAIAPRH
jgi:glutathione S-transferase